MTTLHTRDAWIVPDRVIYAVAEGDVTMELIDSAERNTLRYMGNPSIVRHMILDASQLSGIPPLQAVIRRPSIPKFEGWFIIIGLNNRFYRFVFTVMSQTNNGNLKLVDSLEEALAVLNRVDLSLPDLSDVDLDRLEWVDQIRDGVLLPLEERRLPGETLHNA